MTFYLVVDAILAFDIGQHLAPAFRPHTEVNLIAWIYIDVQGVMKGLIEPLRAGIHAK